MKVYSSRSFKQLSVILIAVLMILSLVTPKVKVSAADRVLSFNMPLTDYLTETDDSNMYDIIVTKAGRVSFDLTSYVESYTSIKLTDQDNDEIFEKEFNSSSKTPGRYSHSVDLEPGKYSLEITDDSSYSTRTGKYIIKTDFTSAGNDDKEPNNGTVEAQSLSFNQAVTGFISWNDTVDYYKLVVPKAGKVNIDLTSYMDTYTSIDMFDSDNDEVYSTAFKSSSKNPEKHNKSVNLEAGTYFIKVYTSSYNNYSGKYLLKTMFTAANNTEKEPNNGTVEAEPLSFNKTVTGFLSWNDSVDMYKITLPKTGTVKLALNSYLDNYTYFNIIDNNNNTIYERNFSSTSKNPGKLNESLTLEKGTYYLKFYYTYNDTYTGKYSLKVTAPFLTPFISLDKVSDKSTAIKGKTVANQEVVIKASGKIYKQRTGSTGTFSVKIPKQKAGSKITVTAGNKHGTKTVTLTVLDKTAPSVPTVSAITSKSKTVNGNAEAGATVYLYNGSKKIGSTKAASNKKYKMKIQKVKKGTTLKAYTVDKAGNKSKVKNITVK